MPRGTEAVERRLIALRKSYEVPVERETYDLDERGHERALERREWGVVGTARVWVKRDGTALLVREVGRPETWGVPGGLVEPDESVVEAGRREVREETGVDCEPFDVAYAHRAVLSPPGDDPDIEELAVAFLGRYRDGDVRPEPGEIRDVAWFRSLPASVRPPADRLGATRL